MPRYWVIAPIESKPSENFDEIWKFDLVNNLISIGWYDLGDVSTMSRDQLFAAVASEYPDKPAPKIEQITGMIWSFYHEIAPGDFVIARRGRKILEAVGLVILPAFYAEGMNPAEQWHSNFLSVEWQNQPRNKVFPDAVFPTSILAELSEEQYHSFLESPEQPPVVASEQPAVASDKPLVASDKPLVASERPPVVENSSAVGHFDSLVLEKYLEDLIVSNFETIFKRTLTIYEDSKGKDGQHYATEIGPIDILAVEPKSNAFVVIELMKDRPSDQVVGQILRHMGWVKKNLCRDGQAVKGLVLCRDPDPQLSYALEMTTNIDVRYYSMSFKLSDTP